MKKMKLNCGVRLYEQEGEVICIKMNSGDVISVLHEYDNPYYYSGKAIVIFDGEEAISVCASMLDEVDES